MAKLRLLILLLFAWCMTGCVAGKIVATPVVFVRDVVDAPLVSLTNVFEVWADKSDPWAAPSPGVGWTWNGGFNLGVAYPLGFFVFKGLSGVLGGVDYIVCRSLYPNFAAGLSPWKRDTQKWGDLYFPGTRAVWGDHPPDTTWEHEPDPPPDTSPPPKE